MLSSLLPAGVNFSFLMKFQPYDQIPASLLIAIYPPRRWIFSLFIGNWSTLTPLDWRELVICTVEIGVVVTVGLIIWLYHWKKVDGEDFPDPLNTGTFNYEPPKSLCGICFEDVEAWKMYKNSICSHSFCCDCTTKHIGAKIQTNVINILCPQVNCKTPLDFNSCQKILPKKIIDKWDELVCMSLIPVSQRIYCPFRDCLAMLVNDSGRTLIEVKCPACRRLFCATCSVAWHPEFSCEEFRRLNGKREKRGEQFVIELAKKNSWRKCPNCKVFVEKTEGCLHITCRCKFEFCYRCGEKWSQHKRSCKSAS